MDKDTLSTLIQYRRRSGGDMVRVWRPVPLLGCREDIIALTFFFAGGIGAVLFFFLMGG